MVELGRSNDDLICLVVVVVGRKIRRVANS